VRRAHQRIDRAAATPAGSAAGAVRRGFRREKVVRERPPRAGGQEVEERPLVSIVDDGEVVLEVRAPQSLTGANVRAG